MPLPLSLSGRSISVLSYAPTADAHQIRLRVRLRRLARRSGLDITPSPRRPTFEQMLTYFVYCEISPDADDQTLLDLMREFMFPPPPSFF